MVTAQGYPEHYISVVLGGGPVKTVPVPPTFYMTAYRRLAAEMLR